MFLLFTFISKEKALQAQTTYNPYSMQGIGEVDMGEYGNNAGMAGVCIGLRSQGFLNNTNPASLSELDSTAFIYEFATSLKFSNFQSVNQQSNAINANFKKLAMGFQVAPYWAMSFGLAPFSSVGYNIVTPQYIDGSGGNNTYIYNTGNGGINKIFLSNAFKLSSKISFGINSSILFGNINNDESTSSGSSVEETSTAQKVYFDFGMQYADTVFNNARFVFGLVYGYKAEIDLENNTVVTKNGISIPQQGYTEIQYIPSFYGIGLSASISNKLTLAADYLFQKWSAISSNIANVAYIDMHKLKLGVEMVPNKQISSSFFQRLSYQGGFTIGNSYLELNNEKTMNYGLCFGLGLPVRRIGLVNFAVEFGEKGSSDYWQVRETYTQFSISLSFTDKWFIKRKYD